MAKGRKGSTKHGSSSVSAVSTTATNAVVETSERGATKRRIQMLAPSLKSEPPPPPLMGSTPAVDGSEHSMASPSLAPEQQAIQNNVPSLNAPSLKSSLREWLFVERRGLYWLLFFVILGFISGFITGAMQGDDDDGSVQRRNHSWYNELPRALQISGGYAFLTNLLTSTGNQIKFFSEILSYIEREYEIHKYFDDPTNTRAFGILREAIVRESGGYVHPDLGILYPAPSGSIRGIGMVRSSYYNCQRRCFPSTDGEKRELEIRRANGNLSAQDSSSKSYDNNDKVNSTRLYQQEEILIRVPLKFQITRTVALTTLKNVIPENVQKQTNMHSLDDAILLAMFLAHERGVGEYSNWAPYLISLPLEPTCGYSRRLRPYMLNAIEAYQNELGIDTNGWAEELYKAMLYAERIVDTIHTNFGTYIKSPRGATALSSIENLRWALCQVSSRATAGSKRHGALRLIPMVDLINHDAEAGSFVELSGTERMGHSTVPNVMSEDDSGTIVVRSLRNGRLRPLRQGQELLVNYNVPYYTPLDWFVSAGFIPRERWGAWVKMDAVLPQVRRDGSFGFAYGGSDDRVKRREEQLLIHLKDMDLF
jgi:hypothetical protein